MMISTRGRYALRLLVDLAEHQKDGYVPLKEIAARQEISEKYLESIVKELVKARILEGLRGKGGGYRLTRGAEDISVLEVLTLMEGTLVPVACLAENCRPCERVTECRMRPLWEGLNDAVSSYLGRFSVQDLAGHEADGFDYVI